MIHFCFSVTQDCLQLIADSDTPTIRKGNKKVSVIFPLRIQSSPITCKFPVQRLYPNFISNRFSTLKLLWSDVKITNLNLFKMIREYLALCNILK